MITAIDTNVLLDVFGADPTFGLRSKEVVRSCIDEGTLVACEVVWAEISSFFPSQDSALAAMRRIGVEFSPLTLESALSASKAWKSYKVRGGKRQRVVPDFLIGAHAFHQADRLLTRDRGFYRAYFTGLRLLGPE